MLSYAQPIHSWVLKTKFISYSWSLLPIYLSFCLKAMKLGRLQVTTMLGCSGYLFFFFWFVSFFKMNIKFDGDLRSLESRIGVGWNST